jgi:hypothetical protein
LDCVQSFYKIKEMNLTQRDRGGAEIAEICSFHKIKEVNLTQRDRGGAEIAERFVQAGWREEGGLGQCH